MKGLCVHCSPETTFSLLCIRFICEAGFNRRPWSPRNWFMFWSRLTHHVWTVISQVDRSVTGLVAQQQCVGPLHTPLADVAVTALSHFATRGTATAIGEQPIKMLVDEPAGARMAVGEALTNLVFASVSDLRDVKCSANWMWPAKLPGKHRSAFLQSSASNAKHVCVAWLHLVSQCLYKMIFENWNFLHHANGPSL